MAAIGVAYATKKWVKNLFGLSASDNTPAEAIGSLISADADNALELGSDDKLFAASGGGGGVQFMSGTENPPTTQPTDTAVGAVYYNTSTKFYWNWNIGAAAWIPVPKVYRALLTQEGISAPAATVLENTLGGTVTWVRQGQSIYRASGVGLFPTNKTIVCCGAFGNGNSYFGAYISNSNFSPDYVELSVISLHLDEAPGNISFTTGDEDNLLNYPIEILVFP